ncbi:ribose transport system ATP-binding protein [Nonomuraea thailandensis]|uniref:Ribose transport system ATP-binding protein n=1 Tax=Nonomuraea thailandensis TaxID=1188745 RepID=A0A9X2GD40_9ACTN|nr:sugar ABC transporter ATP-binding protein [Nonomuraea thailandensis]MCP2356612.1 ribose transport system ATP-binding protein [Nonomuraea thailandensis]
MRGIGKSFLGVRVLSGVDLAVTAGEVHAVVGENGAGKSTLMKIICGVHAPDEGTIELDGRPVSFGHPLEAQRVGIAIIHQEFNLLPERTVAQNVFLGREPVRRGLVDRAAMEEATARLLGELGEEPFGPRDAVRRLSVAQQQIVEIVKALSVDARLVVMDEPSAALAEHEVELLHRLIGRLRERGVAVVYISHRLREVFGLADRVTVLKDGARVTTRPIGEVTPDELIRLMVGRDLGACFPPRSAGAGEVRLSLRGAGNHKLRDIDLDLRAGEIVGIAGLQGSGRSALAKAIFGAEPFTTGEMVPARPRSVREGVRLGIGLVTEDRKAEGLALRQSVRDNALLVARAAGGRGRTRDGVRELLERVRLAPARQDQEVRYLSGGNQQKVVLVKWMAVAPRVLLFDEPTRGVDVGAKAAIHDLMRELADGGMAIMMISSELPELIGLSDRVVVLRDGRVAGTLPAEPSEEAIMRLAAGGVA